MKTLTFGKRVSLGFVAVIFVTCVLGGLAFNRFLIVSAAGEFLATDPVPGTISIIDMAGSIKENFGLVHMHVMAADKAKVAAAITKNREHLNELFDAYEKTITAETDRALFNHFKEVRAAFVGHFTRVIALSDAGQVAEAVQVAEKDLQPAYAKVDEAIGSLVEYNKNNLHGGIARVQHASHLGKLTILVGLAVALAAAAVIAFGIVRSTNKILNEVAGTLDVGSEQVACAASQVSASSQSLAQGSSEQAASLEETSASMEEMASMTKRNAENSQEARGAANQARVSADEGARQIQAMQVAMDGIQNASKEIAKILKTIDEIAFETNILALNAAVEAARAGEAGSGFAVVAEEVRALAQRCSAAAKETAQKIEDAGTKSTQGVQISEKVTKSFETIQGHIHRVDRIVGEIATASDEQSQGIHQVTTAVSQMDQVTQSTASSAEETAAAAEELTAQASVMRDTVGQLMKFIGSVAKSTPDLGNDEISATRKAPSPRAEARGERRPSFSGFLKRGAAPRAGSNGTADSASRGVVKMNGKIPNSDSFADQH